MNLLAHATNANIGLWFWIIFVVALIVGGLGVFRPDGKQWIGLNLVLVVLLAILGWAVFGGPAK